MATIILTGGGTAGHCIPHLALLPYLKKDFDNIYYIGSENGIERDIISPTGIEYFSVNCAKLQRKFCLSNFTIPIKVTSGVIEAKKILDKLKPDIIFSKGGYVSIPVVLAGKMRKIPIIAHESDYSLGLANKVTAKYCKKILTSFPDTAKNLKNGEYTGSPIRKSNIKLSKKEILSSYKFSDDKPVLLITGGSQGAKIINENLRKALPDLLPKYNILHLCGKNNISPEHKQNGYFQAEFINNIENAFSITDVCVSRAGSNTVFELLSKKIPTILIPLPKGISRGDQIQNAVFFQKQGLATTIFQDTLSPESLSFAINSMYANRFNLIRNFDKNPIKDASRTISRIITDCIN